LSAVFSKLSLNQIKHNRSEVETMIKDDLNHHFEDRGLVCEGFLLSEVKYIASPGKEETILKEDTTIVSQHALNSIPTLPETR